MLLADRFLVNQNLAKGHIMFSKKMVEQLAEKIKQTLPKAGQPAPAPRPRGIVGSAVINALQQAPQSMGSPRRRGIAGAVQEAARVGVLRPTAMKKGGAVKKTVVKKVAVKKPVMKAKAGKK